MEESPAAVELDSRAAGVLALYGLELIDEHQLERQLEERRVRGGRERSSGKGAWQVFEYTSMTVFVLSCILLLASSRLSLCLSASEASRAEEGAGGRAEKWTSCAESQTGAAQLGRERRTHLTARKHVALFTSLVIRLRPLGNRRRVELEPSSCGPGMTLMYLSICWSVSWSEGQSSLGVCDKNTQ
eukprot:268825-Hanusia_phi.AAC.2